jgi:hypothetical protein
MLIISQNTGYGMLFFMRGFILTLILLISSGLFAQNESKTVYIYQDGNVLVHESQMVNLSRGIQEVTLTQLPEYIDFESLMLRLTGRVHDLRWTMPESKGWMESLKSFVGQQITLEHTSGQRISGVPVFAESGSTVIRLSDNTHTLIHNLDGYTINASSWNLTSSKPSIVARVEPSRAGNQLLSMTYFTPGLNWNNRYMMIVSQDDKTASISGFTQIRNTSSQSFENIDVRLVAGSLNRRKNVVTTAYESQLRVSASLGASMDLPQDISSAAFGDLQLFTVAGKHSLNTSDQLRIPLFSADGVQVQKRYRYRSMDRNHEFPQSGLVQIHYDVQNSSKNKLGQALPNGVVSLYRINEGHSVLIGEDTIGNIAVDGMLSVNSGAAFDILLKETISNQNRITDRIFEYTVEVIIQNRKSEAVVVELERHLNPNQTIVRSGQPFKQHSARHQYSELSVPAGGELKFEFVIRNDR